MLLNGNKQRNENKTKILKKKILSVVMLVNKFQMVIIETIKQRMKKKCRFLSGLGNVYNEQLSIEIVKLILLSLFF